MFKCEWGPVLGVETVTKHNTASSGTKIGDSLLATIMRLVVTIEQQSVCLCVAEGAFGGKEAIGPDCIKVLFKSN